jgi:hypothetical protein
MADMARAGCDEAKVWQHSGPWKNVEAAMRMLTVLTTLVVLAGCSAPSVYHGTREWRVKECSHLLEPERSECERAARDPLPEPVESEHVR